MNIFKQVNIIIKCRIVVKLHLFDITQVEHNTNVRKLFKIFKCISQAILARE